MARVIVRHQNNTLGEFPLRPGVNTIGRLPTHPICIENLGISRNHAFILGDVGESLFILEDLKSLNGTYVNKKRVHKHLLRTGDVITIGQHSLEFREDIRLVPGESLSREEHQALSADPGSSELAAVNSAKQVNAPQLEDLETGRIWPMQKDILYFGNSSDDDISVPGLVVGKNFASLNRKGTVWVVNLLVKRFTHLRLNGEDTVSAKVKDGDVLDVAGLRLRIRLP